MPGTCAVERLQEKEGRDQSPVAVSDVPEELHASTIAQDVLPQLVEAVARALRLPYVAIELMQAHGRVVVASYGRPTDTPVVLPFTHQGEIVAWLLLGQRSHRKALRRRDGRVLRDLVSPVGAATQTLRQAVELQRLREQLVTAREEERRRLRRDLHDSVGSSVAAAVLHLQVAEDLIRTDPKAAKELIGEVRAEAKTLVEQIRRLADCLGHSALDQVGLVSAIREQVSGISDVEAGEGAGDCGEVTIETVGIVENLPAAIEVAAFHIVSDAITGALRHGAATKCQVRLSCLSSDLEVEVVSDGSGQAADLRSDKLVSSMRMRADELGGAVSVEPLSSGRTVLRARLPLPRD